MWFEGARPPPVPSPVLAVAVQCETSQDGLLERKFAALDGHRTQGGGLTELPGSARHWQRWSTESLVDAARRPGNRWAAWRRVGDAAQKRARPRRRRRVVRRDDRRCQCSACRYEMGCDAAHSGGNVVQGGVRSGAARLFSRPRSARSRRRSPQPSGTQNIRVAFFLVSTSHIYLRSPIAVAVGADRRPLRGSTDGPGRSPSTTPRRVQRPAEGVLP